jgi:DNA-binding PadR family transcriptional regulator
MHDHKSGDDSCGCGGKGPHAGHGPHGGRGMHGGFRPPFGGMGMGLGMGGGMGAGSVYPTLQLMADEGLIKAEETAGKKVFSLTEAGTAAVAENADQPAPWEEVAQSDAGNGSYREAVAKLMHAAFQIGKSGSTNQVAAGIEVLNDARKKLYAILAED